MNDRRRAGLGLALVTATISGVSVFVNGLAVKAFPDATAYTTAKNLVAAVLLGGLAVLAARRWPAGAGASALSRPHGIRTWLALAAVGVVGGSVPFVLFFEGLARTSSVQAAVLHKTLLLWVGLAAVVVLRERVGWAHLAAVLLLMAGQVGLSGGFRVPVDAGALLILAATLLWSVEVIVAKRLLATVSPAVLGVARMGLGSVVLLGWAVASGSVGATFALTLTQWGWVLVTGLLLTGYVATWYAALARAQALDVTAVLVVGAVVTAALSAAGNAGAVALQLPWLVVLLAGTALVGWTMLRSGPAGRLP